MLKEKEAQMELSVQRTLMAEREKNERTIAERRRRAADIKEEE